MTSYPQNIPTIIDIVEKIMPKKILDIGAGYGKFGILCREAILSKKAEIENKPIPTNDISINRLEEATYFANLQWVNAIYTKSMVGNFLQEGIENFNAYDLILLIDVVEHNDIKEVKAWLRNIGVPVIISTPKKIVMYETEFYNSRKHISQWEQEDFAEFRTQDFSNDLSWIFLINPINN